MFRLDESIAALSDGSSTVVVLLVAALLGLRHATDPDHLAAVATLVLSRGEAAQRDARRLGLAWGLGHAVSLMVLGIPIVVFSGFLPASLLHVVEVSVGALVMALSARVLVRWRCGYWHVHSHAHEGGPEHVHLHVHDLRDASHEHTHARPRDRSPAGAFAVGIAHGVGGSAGIGLLLLASIDALALALGALVFFAGLAAVSMTLISDGIGRALTCVTRQAALGLAIPTLAVATFAVGAFYAATALALPGP